MHSLQLDSAKRLVHRDAMTAVSLGMEAFSEEPTFDLHMKLTSYL
jgi:hypothetical protein